MADEYDGRVVINTELDTSGFTKGSAELISAMKGVETKINNLGAAAAQAFEEPQHMQMKVDTPEPAEIREQLEDAIETAEEELPPVQPHIDSTALDKEAGAMQRKLSGITNEVYRMVSASAQGFRSSGAVLAFDNQLGKAQDHIADARAELEAFAEQELPTDKYAEVTSAAEKAEAELAKLQDKLARTVASGADKPSQAWKEAHAGFEAAMADVDEYGTAIKNMYAKGIRSGDNWDFVKEQYEKAVSLMESYEAKLDELEAKGENHSQSWRNTALQIEATEQKLASYAAEQKALIENGEAFIDPKTTEEYEAMEEELRAAEAALQTNVGLIRQEEIEQARLNVLTAQEKVANADNAVARQLALRQLQTAQNELAAIAQKSVTPAPDPDSVSAWDKFGKVISGIGGGAIGLGKKLGSIVKTVGSVSKKVTGFVKGIFSKLKGASGIDGLTKKLTGLKGMLVSRVKRTFISFLFSQITESFKELAKFDAKFDQAISNMQNRTKELGANIMATLGPLIQKIEPIITGLISKASDAVVKINAAFAALRGESTMTVAAERTESYAASLDSAASSAKKAKTAQDKLNATLTSYDEIHKLSDDKAADAAESATDAASAPVYKTVEVEPVLSGMDEAVRGLITRMKDAVKRGDWGGVGSAIAEGFNLGVSALDEAIIKARDKVITGAHNLAEALNGLTEGFDAYSFGKTIADGLELGLDTAYEFLTTYDFGKLGQRAAEGINGLVTNLNAEKVGRTIASVINAAIHFGFDFVTNLKWDTIGEKLGTAFNRLFRDIDWKELAGIVGEGVKGIFNSISSFLETADWDQVGAAIITFLTEIDWGGVAQAFWRLLGSAIGGISGLIKGAFKAIAEKSANWGEHLFDEYGSEFNAAGEQVGAGIWKGIKNMFTGAVKKCKENMLDPLISGFKKAFGISSPSKKMVPYGEYVAEGIMEGIKDIFAAPADWIRTNVLEPFKRGFSTAFNVVSDKAQSLVSSGKSIAGGIKSGIETGWGTVTTILGNKAEDIKNFFKSDDFKSAGEKIADGITSGVNTGKLSSIGEDIVNAINSGLLNEDMLNLLYENAGTIGKNTATFMFNGLDEQIEGRFSETLASMQNWPSQAIEAFNQGNTEGITVKYGYGAIRALNEIPTVTPSIVTGNFAPSGTTPTDEISSDTSEIKQLLQRFLERADELEAAIAGRPIRLESHVEINRRELGLAVAEYNTTTGNIINGTGGAW